MAASVFWLPAAPAPPCATAAATHLAGWVRVHAAPNHQIPESGVRVAAGEEMASLLARLQHPPEDAAPPARLHAAAVPAHSRLACVREKRSRLTFPAALPSVMVDFHHHLSEKGWNRSTPPPLQPSSPSLLYGRRYFSLLSHRIHIFGKVRCFMSKLVFRVILQRMQLFVMEGMFSYFS